MTERYTNYSFLLFYIMGIFFTYKEGSASSTPPSKKIVSSHEMFATTKARKNILERCKLAGYKPPLYDPPTCKYERRRYDKFFYDRMHYAIKKTVGIGTGGRKMRPAPGKKCIGCYRNCSDSNYYNAPNGLSKKQQVIDGEPPFSWVF